MDVQNRDFSALAAAQRAYFQSGATRPLSFRMQMLETLRRVVRENEQVLAEAMAADFRKSAFEVYMTETGLVLDEIGFHLRHLRGWMRERRVRTPLAQFPSASFVSPEPYGVALILAPWNYPIQLCLEPLIGAISAGNCAVLKPSAYTPETSRVLAEMIGKSFPREYIAVVEGGRAENQALLHERFDYIFFTGSPSVGRLVMQCAAEYLTPVTLELGGKSPVIVDKTANVRLAARRVMFGKVLNAGQTCVEPDYAFVHADVLDEFLDGCRAALREFFPTGDYGEMPVIVNEKHYRRVRRLMQGETAAVGGGSDDASRWIAPTVLTGVTPESPVMREEIFGPVLPVMTWRDIGTCIEYITSHEKPLALYLFTADHALERRVLDSCSFGGGCINDTIVHLATPHMPFGGVGASGMGSYHGRKSFDTFTHERSILKKACWLDLPIRYHPYTQTKARLLRLFLK